ncbi:MAG TPA: transposase [Phycisphaerae bacterium]|nr:transposase [Phycisphaerae bacterium]HNU46902.1 transposase [Phycisphaerae bacterium]
MGEGHGWSFEPTFNRAIKLRQADPRITSDVGAHLLRQADHHLGLTADLAAQLTDHRRPDRIRYLQVELRRQHLCALAPGYAHPARGILLAAGTPLGGAALRAR